MLQVDYPVPLTDLHLNQQGLSSLQFKDVCTKLFEFTAVIIRNKKITIVKTKNVAGKLPLSLNRSSPKTIGLENSTIQGCVQNII